MKRIFILLTLLLVSTSVFAKKPSDLSKPIFTQSKKPVYLDRSDRVIRSFAYYTCTCQLVRSGDDPSEAYFSCVDTSGGGAITGTTLICPCTAADCPHNGPKIVQITHPFHFEGCMCTMYQNLNKVQQQYSKFVQCCKKDGIHSEVCAHPSGTLACPAPHEKAKKVIAAETHIK